MVRITHRLDKDLRTLQHALPTLSIGFLPHESAMRILKVKILDRIPDRQHLVRG